SPFRAPCKVTGLRAGADSPSSSSVAITLPTGRRVPGSTSNSNTVPSCQISTSTAAFEVSTTATTWPFFTLSPGLTCHSSSLPSSMSAPSEGSLNSNIQHLLHRGDDLRHLWQRRRLHVTGVGDRHLRAAHPPRR